MTLDEACKILNVQRPSPKSAETTDMAPITERFKRLFDANDPKQGGSFYLQSKVLRARERIELEVQEAEQRIELAAQQKKWNDPGLIYKNYKSEGTARPQAERQQQQQPPR